ncbi:hypothetical protein NDU88_005328 [Pleurodeles waltl]|uniref:Uncharacterized protein n=1 Tax=Pleurodeles waltl TaxID=8319 RepID=A0AAV7QIN8_PLEWA|nr:hypothetical protein NDU88_005328 [Pleurodeles waltl]
MQQFVRMSGPTAPGRRAVRVEEDVFLQRLPRSPPAPPLCSAFSRSSCFGCGWPDQAHHPRAGTRDPSRHLQLGCGPLQCTRVPPDSLDSRTPRGTSANGGPAC